jgi:hypothetical protein
MTDENNLKTDQEGVANGIKRVGYSEWELITRLRPDLNPPVLQHLKGAISALEEIKRHYFNVLSDLSEIKEFYPLEHKKNITDKIEGTKSVILGTDQAITTLKGLIEALRIAPTRFFAQAKGGETK